MERKEDSKDEDRIDRYAHKKDCKRERKESTSCTHRSIRKEKHGKKYIYTESYDRSERYLIESMECPVVVHDQSSCKYPKEKKDIKFCHLKCLCKCRNEAHKRELRT